MTQEEFQQQVYDIPDRKLIEMATISVENMCRTNGKSFTMSVPMRADDTDVVLTEIIRRFEEKTILP